MVSPLRELCHLRLPSWLLLCDLEDLPLELIFSMHSEASVATRLRGYIAYTLVGSGIAGFCDGTLQSCTLAKPSSVAYDPSREAFFVLDQQLTHGIRVITKDWGVHTLLWQPDCTLRAPHSLAILNNILLIADTGNGSIRYLLLTNYFKVNQKRAAIQFCSSTCGTLRTLSLDVTQPVSILPYSPTSFLVLDAVQRSVKLVLLDVFLEQPSGGLLLAVQAVETLYVGTLRVPSNMIDLYRRKYLLVSDKATLVIISIETKRGAKFRLRCYSFSTSQHNNNDLESKNEVFCALDSMSNAFQSYIFEPKHISGLSAHRLSSTQEIIFLTDNLTHTVYYTILDLQSILDSLISEGVPKEPADQCIDVYQLTSSMRRTGYQNGTLKKAEFSNPQGILAFTLDGQLCVSVCDTGNSVIRLIGPNFLKQERKQPAYLQVQADNHDLIQGKVRVGADKYLLALRRALQQVKFISISSATITDIAESTRTYTQAAPLVPQILAKKQEHNKNLLHQYLAKANIACAVEKDAHLEPCRLEDLGSSDTPSLASEDPLTTELVSIKKATEKSTQIEQNTRSPSTRKVSRPASRIKSHTDASVQFEPEKIILTANRSTQAESEVGSSTRSEHDSGSDSLSLKSMIFPQNSSSTSANTPEDVPPCYISNSTRWEFQIIKRTWSILHEHDADMSLVHQLDSLMDESHLFDIYQKTMELSTALLALNDSRLIKELLRLTLTFFKKFSNLNEYIILYQSTPFPKKFKPSIKCLLLLQRILADQLAQLSDIAIYEILLPLITQRWFSSTSSDITYLSLLGWGSKWTMVLAIKLLKKGNPVLLVKPPGNKLGIHAPEHTLVPTFAIESDTNCIDFGLFITIIVADKRFERKQILIKLTGGAEIIALESCRSKIFHNQEPCGPVLSSHISLPLTSITELTLKVSCAELAIRTQIPIKLVSSSELEASKTITQSLSSHTVPVWLIDIMKYTLIVGQR